MTGIRDIWVYLSATPLLHLTLTLIAYQAGQFIYRHSNSNPLLNPVTIAVATLVTVLTMTGTSYESYFEGAQFVHFLLGRATVALALPLYRQLERVKRSALALTVSLLAGSATAATTAVTVGWLLGASRDSLISLAPKSVTSPVAMSITEKLGGLPSFTVVLVILTGIVGASLGPIVLKLAGVGDPAARGLALGTASHGFGTARGLQMSDVAGAFAGLAMGLNALASAILIPLVWHLVFG